MAGFLGSYLHQFDAKGRISLPAPYRRGHETDAFVLVPVRAHSLTLYPEETWLKKQDQLLDMLSSSPELRPQVLRLTARAHEVTLDSQGRINVPERLRSEAALGSEALIVGAIDKVEIWNPERFERETSEESDDFERYKLKIFA